MKMPFQVNTVGLPTAYAASYKRLVPCNAYPAAHASPSTQNRGPNSRTLREGDDKYRWFGTGSARAVATPAWNDWPYEVECNEVVGRGKTLVGAEAASKR